MLSRIAEALFWIGRYVERADDTARLLDVHVQLLAEDPWAEEDLACRSLLSVMDRPVPAPGVEVGREHVLAVLAYERWSASSVTGAVVAARENARRVREIISTELWECLNATWSAVPAMTTSTGPHEFFTWVRERSAMVAGIVDSALSRDETWQFLVLGRSIERADMTARLLTTRALAGSTGPSWTALLRSCGAYEAFLRTYRGAASDERMAGFLLRDRLFPRSVVHALEQADVCLAGLEPVVDRSTVEDARRHVGRVRAALEFSRLGDLVDDLPGQMALVQRGCSAASDAVRARYFPTPLVTTWVGEAL